MQNSKNKRPSERTANYHARGCEGGRFTQILKKEERAAKGASKWAPEGLSEETNIAQID